MRFVPVVVLALLLSSPALAQDVSDREAAERAWFEAYYLEHGKRDLDAAEKAYEGLEVHREGLEDLRVRKFLGLARVAARRGTRAPSAPATCR